MTAKKILFWAGVAASVGAAILSVVSLDDPKLNPVSAIALAAAAFALFKGSELG
jgi:hypothetical protein